MGGWCGWVSGKVGGRGSFIIWELIMAARGGQAGGIISRANNIMILNGLMLKTGKVRSKKGGEKEGRKERTNQERREK